MTVISMTAHNDYEISTAVICMDLALYKINIIIIIIIIK